MSVSEFLQSAWPQARSVSRAGSSSLLTVRRTQTIAVASVCTALVVFVAATVHDVRDAHRRWSGSRPVLVATREVSPGETIDADDVALRSFPEAIVPADALTEIPDGARTRVALTPRTVITATLVADATTMAPVPAGWRVVALPASLPMPPVEVADLVDVIGGSSVIAESAIVISRDPLTLAVPADVAPLVASAVRLGEISLVATG